VTLVAQHESAQQQSAQHAQSAPDEGLGRVHVNTSCSPAVAADFDRALALLHNFWYVRALERFNQVAEKIPGARWRSSRTTKRSCSNLLLELNRPEEALTYFGRP
jgi:hypothetical protein